MTLSTISHPLKLRIITSSNELVVPLPNPDQTNIKPSFGKSEPAGLYDLYNIAVAMHEIERLLHSSAKIRKDIKEVILPITHETLRDMDQKAVCNILGELSLAIFSRNIEFGFESCSDYQSGLDREYCEYNAVCLFSGGADSFVGVLDSKGRYHDILALNVRHDFSSKVNGYVTRLNDSLLSPECIPLESFDVPKQIGKGYSQTRGILYQACAGISAFRHSSKKVVLSECGTTIYQPHFGLFDRVTYTSDPLVQMASKKLVRELLDYKLEIVTPFEGSTKSEMFASSRHKEQLRDTFSCISSRFGSNLGCCYGCAIRRIGFLVAGVEDCQYDYDLFSIEDNNILTHYGRGKGAGRMTDFLELMRFSLDVLVDYESIHPVKRRRIEQHHKKDLFRRFSLDTFAALSIASENGHIRNSRLRRAYADAMNYICKSDLEERIERVRELTND
jgi:7-cyano-7-deazaguanine synthase in queuosine biosynthesis